MKKSLLLGLLITINSILIAQNPIADFNFTNVCLGSSTTFTDLTTNSPTSWDWNFGDGSGISTQQNPTYTYATPGNYTVTLIVFNGVGYDTIPKVVTVFANPTINVSANQTICIGSVAPLIANGGISYNWTPSTGLSSTTVSSPMASPTTTTTYTVTATDGNGCVGNNSITVTVNPLPIINAGPDQFICSGDGFTPMASGGVSYIWDNGATNGSPVYPSVNTSYTVIGTDINGCENSDSIFVTVSPAIFLADNVTNVSCNGGADGSISVTPTGGQAPYTYLWSTIGATTPFVTGLAAGTYTVTVTDANGCSEVLNSTVTEPTAITVNPSSSDVTCYGTCDGTISLTPSGGTAPYSYSWSSGGTTQSITNLCTGIIAYTVTDANGCTSIDSVSLTQPSPAGVIRGIVNFQAAHVTAGNVDLIKKNGNTPADIQTQSSLSMDTSGTFTFSNLYPGTYLLKALGDTFIYNNVATYADNTNQWQLATEYNTTGCPGDTVNGVIIDLIELPVYSGVGTVNGRLVEGGSGVFNKAPGDPLSDIDITIDQSPGGTIMNATTTDVNGYFTFNNLPNGSYTLYADIPGYGVTNQVIDINSTTSSFDVVLCTNDTVSLIDMCELNVTSVNDLQTKKEFHVFPNPANDFIHVAFTGNSNFKVNITDITGKVVLTKNLNKSFERIDISTLHNGIYFIRIQSDDKDFVQKLMVK